MTDLGEDTVESVARAIWWHRQDAARKALIDPPLEDWHRELPELRDDVRAEARVAILAYERAKI